jgi:hypothetical protein
MSFSAILIRRLDILETMQVFVGESPRHQTPWAGNGCGVCPRARLALFIPLVLIFVTLFSKSSREYTSTPWILLIRLFLLLQIVPIAYMISL